MPKSKKRKYLLLFIRIIVISGGIIWGISRIGQEQRWSSFLEYLKQMNIGVFILTLGIFTIGHFIVALRWWLLLKTQSIFISFWAAVRLYFLGWFYNNFMPSSVGGDLVRAWYVTQHTDKKFEAALSVFVDRIIGLLSTLVIAVFFYVLFFQGQGLDIAGRSQDGFIVAVAEYKLALLVIIGVIAVVFCALMAHSKSRAKIKKIWSLTWLHGMRMIKKLRDAAVLYLRKPMAILAVFGLTVFMQIMVITAFWFLGRNMGIEVSIKYYYVFFTLAWVVGVIPVSIGGAVVIEGFLVIMFTKFAGVDESAAWAIALCQRAVWMLTSLPGAVIHLLGAHLPKDFSIDYEPPIE